MPVPGCFFIELLPRLVGPASDRRTLPGTTPPDEERFKDAPIGLVPEDFAPAKWLGLLGFAGIVVWLYRWMVRRSMVTR